jgi:hypothetical protein
MFTSKHVFYRSMSCSESSSLSPAITARFCPEQLLAGLSSFALVKGFLWARATNAASSAGLDTRHNPIPVRLPTCPSVRYFCSHVLAKDPGTPYRPPAALTLNPPSSTRAMTRSRIDRMWWATMKRAKKECFDPHTSFILAYSWFSSDTKQCWNTPSSFLQSIIYRCSFIHNKQESTSWAPHETLSQFPLSLIQPHWCPTQITNETHDRVRSISNVDTSSWRYIRSPIEYMPRRMRSVVEAQGLNTSY